MFSAKTIGPEHQADRASAEEETPTRFLARYAGQPGCLSQILRNFRLEFDALKRNESERLALARQRIAKRVQFAKNKAKQLGTRNGERAQAINNAALLLALELQYQRVIWQAQSDCLEVSLELARGIIKQTPKANASALAKKLKDHLAGLVSNRGLLIEVNGLDSKTVCAALRKEIVDGALQVVTSADLGRGCARVTSSLGCAEFNWEHELEEFHALLRQRLANAAVQGWQPQATTGQAKPNP